MSEGLMALCILIGVGHFFSLIVTWCANNDSEYGGTSWVALHRGWEVWLHFIPIVLWFIWLLHYAQNIERQREVE